MTRTVKVGLQVDEGPFVRGMQRAERAAEGLEDALDDVAGSAKASAAATESAKESTEDLGASAKESARSLNSMREDAKRLDRQIDETSRSIRDLARQIAATSDEAERVDLTKKLHIDQRSLQQQLNLRRLMEVEAEDAASGFVARFGGRIGPLMASMPLSPAGAAIGTALGAAAAPTLGAALAAGVVGGAAGAGIVGGAVLAARDPRVKAAGAELGAFILGDLEGRAAGFVPAMLDAIGDVRSAWAGLGPDLDRIFASSRFVDPLVAGAVSGARELIGGVATAVDRADPVVAAFGASLDRIGSAAGDAFRMLAEDADEGASALNDLTTATANFIEVSAGLVHVAAQVKGYTDNIDVALDRGRYWIEDNSYLAEKLRGVGIELDFTADGFAAGTVEAEAYRQVTLGMADAADFATLKAAGWTDAQIAAKDASGTYRSKLDEVNEALGRTGPAAQTAIEGVRPLNELLDDWANKSLGVEEANIRLEQAIDDAAAAAKEGADKGINPNTQAGRDNRKALLGIVEASKEAAAKIYDQTHSQEAASAATERGRKKFLEAADAMGVGKDAAIALANKLFGIPKDTKPKVTVQDAQAKAAIAAIKSGIATIHDKSVTVTVKYETHGRVQGEHTIGVGTNTKYQRWGGAYEHAREGLVSLREAHIAAPVAPARYAYAEPATGGEAFIPKYGQRERSLDILTQAARWYGQQVIPAGGWTAAGGGSVTHNLNVYPQQANFTVHDLEGLQRRQDAMSRVGRPR